MDDSLTYNQIPGKSFIDKMLYLNSTQDYLIWLLLIVTGFAVLKVLRKVIARKLSGEHVPVVAYLLTLETYIYPILCSLILFTAFHWLNVTIKAAVFFNYVFTVVFIFLFIRLITAASRTAIYAYLGHLDGSGGKAKQVQGIVFILNGALWLVGLIFLFDNLGFNVTAVLTGLGVGGIAIALAAQTILGDIFNYFVIFFDRPFEIGDFIIVDDKMGTVEYIGLKTTRLKSLSGEQIIFSNSNLTNSRVHNYKRMNERRILFHLGVPYDTGSQKLARIPALIRTVVEEQEDTRFDRAHFASYGEYSLNFEVVYYMLSADYNRYMDVQEKINLEVFRKFEQEGVQFAFPTYSIHVNGRTHDKQNGLEYIPRGN